MNAKNGLIAAVVILALALIGSLVWGFNNEKEITSLKGDNAEVTEALDAMTQVRDNLAREVDSLAGEYDLLASENVELNGQLAGSRDDLASAQSALSRAKRNAAAELNDLRAQIEELNGVRSQLQSSISALESENSNLREQMGILETNLTASRQEAQQLTNLASSMETEIQKLSYESFKATAFEISPQLKNGKPSAKPGRVKKLVMSFDVANVPAEFQGVRPVYLVITDANGVPIPRAEYITTSINVNGQTQTIQAVEARDENIGESQRLSFTHELEERLDSGIYRVSVYSDICHLGSSTFTLR